MRTVSHRMPCASSRHSWFDEANPAPNEPRRTALRRNKGCFCVPLLLLCLSIAFYFHTYIAASRFLRPIEGSLAYRGFLVVCLDEKSGPLGSGWRVIHRYSFKRPLGCHSNAVNVYVDFKGRVCGMNGKYQSQGGDVVDKEVISYVVRQEEVYEAMQTADSLSENWCASGSDTINGHSNSCTRASCDNVASGHGGAKENMLECQ